MEKDIFYRAGVGIHRFRWLIIILSVIGFIACLPVLPHVIKPFTSTGFFDETSESAQANNLLNAKLGYSYNRFVVIYNSPNLLATDARFTSDIKKSLSSLKNSPYKYQVIYPDSNKKQISADKHTAYVVILFKSNQEVGHEFVTQLRRLIKTPSHLTMKIGGEPVFLDDVSKQTQQDLNKAEYIGTPAAIIALFIIFGSVIAAFLPIYLGMYCAAVILTTLYCLGHLFSLSIFTVNIALLVGLCLSLDYSLFFISRFRNQVHLGHTAKDAIAVTLSTAGKAIFFSGLAVFISMSALLFFPINVLFSVGVGGLTAVFVALIVTLLILPAILAALNKKIDFLAVRFFKRFTNNYWHWFVTRVVKNPKKYFCVNMLILLILSSPIIYAKFGISNFKIMPAHAESRQFYNIFGEAFGENELTPILVIASTPHQSILSSKSIGQLYDLVRKIKKDPRVHRVDSIVSIDKSISKLQYQMMYQPQQLSSNTALKKYLDMNTTRHLTVLTIVTKQADNTPATRELIQELRKMKPGHGMTLQVTGGPANTQDVMTGIMHTLPYALLWIIIFSYLVLLILLRSVILPLKAIITTTLSLAASYGVLVFIIQQGHFHRLLNFEPQGMLDISLCIIIVCALFGFSMDYEVFLLARIKECYEKSGDTLKSIVLGIDQSSRIITSAAIIVILICSSFMFADILIVKAFGLGIAVAIFVDAFLIRLMLVPATMALLKDWNWYLPAWLEAYLPKVFFNVEDRK